MVELVFYYKNVRYVYTIRNISERLLATMRVGDIFRIKNLGKLEVDDYQLLRDGTFKICCLMVIPAIAFMEEFDTRYHFN